MSVIIRNEEGKVLLLCKGADKYVLTVSKLESVPNLPVAKLKALF